MWSLGSAAVDVIVLSIGVLYGHSIDLIVVPLDVLNKAVVSANVVYLSGDVGATLGIILADVCVLGCVNFFADVV